MSIINPRQTYQIVPAAIQEILEEQRILVFGQVTSGSITPPSGGQYVANIGNSGEEDVLFGADSMLATTIRGIRRISKITRVDAVALADSATGDFATGSHAFGGTWATQAGTFYIEVGSSINNTYEINVAKEDTPTDIGAAIETAISADATAVVGAVNAAGTVTYTAKNKGREGNYIRIRITGEVQGITVISVPMNGGSGEPDGINDGTVFNIVPSTLRFQGIIWPQTYNSKVTPDAEEYIHLRAFLDARFPANLRILDGQAFIGKTDTKSNAETIAAIVDNKNITLIDQKPVNADGSPPNLGGSILELDYVRAAYFVAIRALRFTEDQPISPYIVAPNAGQDNFGGIPLASLPYMNTPFTDLLPLEDHTEMWANQEVVELLEKGVTVMGNNQQNDRVIMGQVATTYLTNDDSIPDVTFKYLNYYDTNVTIREYFFRRFQIVFNQTRLKEGELVLGRSDVNVQTIEAILMGVYVELGDLDLVEKGQRYQRQFADNLLVTIDKANGKITIDMLVNIVTQVHKIDTVQRVTFSVPL